MANDATLHIRLETSLKEQLEQYAKEYDIKLSNVIRIALEEFAEKDHAKETRSISQEIVKSIINSNAF